MIRVLVLLVLLVGSAAAQQSFRGPTIFSQGPTLSEKLGGLQFDMGTSNTIATSDEWVFRLTPFAATITRIECEAYGGTSYTIQLCVGEDTGDDTCGTAYTTAALVCDGDGGSGCRVGLRYHPDQRGRDDAAEGHDRVTAVSTPPQNGEI